MRLQPFASDAARKRAYRHFCKAQWSTFSSCKYFPASYQMSDDYLCSLTVTDHAVSDHLPWHGVPHQNVTEAQKGRYVVSYHVKDRAGNPECETKYRTVIVQDTLPPMITLKYMRTDVVAKGTET